jgi:hypothetical protein
MQREPNHIPQAMSLLSVVRHLERVADHATNIAEDVLFYVKGIDVRRHAEVVAKDESPGLDPPKNPVHRMAFDDMRGDRKQGDASLMRQCSRPSSTLQTTPDAARPSPRGCGY